MLGRGGREGWRNPLPSAFPHPVPRLSGASKHMTALSGDQEPCSINHGPYHGPANPATVRTSPNLIPEGIKVRDRLTWG